MNNEYSPLENFLNAPMIDYYKKHPEEFMEEIFGVKLEPYQKEMLKGLYREMANVDIIKICNDVAKEFPFTLNEIYGFIAYSLVKNGEDGVVSEDDLREYCRKRLLEQYKRS